MLASGYEQNSYGPVIFVLANVRFVCLNVVKLRWKQQIRFRNKIFYNLFLRYKLKATFPLSNRSRNLNRKFNIKMLNRYLLAKRIAK